MPVTSIRLKDDLKESLDELAEKLDRSRNWVINEAIERYIVEDRKLEEQRWQETLPALEESDKGETIPFEEVMERLLERAAKLKASSSTVDE